MSGLIAVNPVLEGGKMLGLTAFNCVELKLEI